MTNIEKIRQEIERRIENYWSDGDVDSVVVSGELEELIDFIDSLPEEKLSYVTDSPGDPGNPGEPGISDLEEAAEEYERENRQSILSSVDIVDAFIAGAEWMLSKLQRENEQDRD